MRLVGLCGIFCFFGGLLVTLLEELVGHWHVDILLTSYNACLAGSRLCNERILAVLLLFVYGRHLYSRSFTAEALGDPGPKRGGKLSGLAMPCHGSRCRVQEQLNMGDYPSGASMKQYYIST